MKIAILGTKTFNNEEFIQAVLNEYFSIISVFIGSSGNKTSQIAENWINQWNEEILKENPKLIVNKIILDSDFDKYGVKAEKVHISRIVELADHLILFSNNQFKEIKTIIDLAIKHNKFMDIYIR